VRTTVSLEPDVAAAVERLRRREGIGMSEAVNRLIRSGLGRPERRSRVRLETSELGLRIDVSNVADALEVAEDPSRR
jgi:metal-responsive CopG/Arc/MetJ family transcriptional regulator